jgi:hypothetical protein
MISEYNWALSDGQTALGKEVTFTLSRAGTVTVTLNAVSNGKVVASAKTEVSALAANALAPAAFKFPAVFGDADGNGALQQGDALAVLQARRGLSKLTAAQISSADLDLSGAVDDEDVRLIQQASMKDEPLPRSVLTKTIRPGAVVAVVSPSLMDLSRSLEIRIGGQASPQVFRVVRGYASFIVPPSLTAFGGTTIEVIANNVVVDRFSVTLLPSPALPSDAAADVQAFLAQLDRDLEAQEKAIDAYATQEGLSANDRSILQGAAKSGRNDLKNASNELARLFSSTGGDNLAKVFQKALYANGLAEAKALSTSSSTTVREASPTNSASAAQSTEPDRVCDILVPGVCGLQAVAKPVGRATEIISGACSVTAVTALVAGAVFPADGPTIEAGALAAFLKVCVPLSASIEIASSVATLVDGIEVDVSLNASPIRLSQGQSSLVRTNVTFVGVENLCSVGTGLATEALINKQIGDRIVGRMLRNNTSLRFLGDFFAKFGEGTYVTFLDSVRSSVSNVLTATKVTETLSGFIGKICPDIRTGAVQARARNFLQPVQADEGTLVFNADGTASYTCPPAGPVFKSEVTLIARRRLCGSAEAEDKVKITCATQSVTITMGDNGSALDDIYEVVVGGRTVLTSSSPVRSTSVTIQLPRGRTEILMRGLAAPDGIGTYFIGFSGAAVVGGDPLSGSDLVPGVTKRFIIEVL